MITKADQNLLVAIVRPKVHSLYQEIKLLKDENKRLRKQNELLISKL